MNGVRRVWREGVWIASGQLVGALGAMLAIRVLTTVLDPPVFGEMALGMTFATLAAQTILGPLASAYQRFFAIADESHHLPQFFTAIFRLTTAASGATALLGLVVVAGLVGSGHTVLVPLAVVATAFALSAGWENILDSIQNAARSRRVVAGHQAVRPWLRPLFAAGLVTAFGASSSLALGGYAVASFTVLASQAIFYLRLIRRSGSSPQSGARNPTLDAELLRYAASFIAWGVFTWLQMSADRWALDAARGTAEVGLYAVLWQLGFYPLNLLGTVVLEVAAPIVFARAGDGTAWERIAEAWRLLVYLAAAMLVATFVIVAVAAAGKEPIFGLLAGPPYQRVAPLLPLAVLGSGLFNVGQVLTLLPLVVRRANMLIAPKAGTAILSAILSLCGAYLLGTTGVVVGGVAFATVYVAWTFLMDIRLIRAARTSVTSPIAQAP